MTIDENTQGKFRVETVPDYLRGRSKRHPKVGDFVWFVPESQTSDTICCDGGKGISARWPVACLVPLDAVASEQWEKAVRRVRSGDTDDARLKAFAARRKAQP